MATPEALELIEHLVELHGPIAFRQAEDFGDAAPAICLTRAELLPTDEEMKLGEIGGSPFYVDAERYEHSGRPSLVVDVAPGAVGRFTLAGLDEVHFATRVATTEPAVG
jgi:uncharacterized protein